MLRGHKHAVSEIDFSPSNDLLCSASCDLTMALWDIQTGAKVRRLKGYASYVHACAANKKNLHVFAGVDDAGSIMVNF